ncbi:hypothetical protein EV421DRAFT_609380 [Armillaria borealis]|uniref:Uncharacterized protein n=1 Tax=Armillaria borealis TaxID=47425 RepID=A0AA39JJY4_9AGAR|nr:hypothetical protein EV421DRAFT_609380 [Armillaria borealis]
MYYIMAAWVTSLTQVGCSLLVLFAPNFAKFSCRYCVRVMPAMIVIYERNVSKACRACYVGLCSCDGSDPVVNGLNFFDHNETRPNPIDIERSQWILLPTTSIKFSRQEFVALRHSAT